MPKEIRQIMAEWEVKQGAGGWAIGYFVCSNCGYKSGEDAPVCPQCKVNMKKANGVKEALHDVI